MPASLSCLLEQYRLGLFELVVIKVDAGFLRISAAFPSQPSSTLCMCAQRGQISYKRTVAGKNSVWLQESI